MAKQYFTAVFEYEGEAPFLKEITTAFKDGVEFNGVRVTGVSLEDEMTRVEQLEEQLNG